MASAASVTVESQTRCKCKQCRLYGPPDLGQVWILCTFLEAGCDADAALGFTHSATCCPSVCFPRPLAQLSLSFIKTPSALAAKRTPALARSPQWCESTECITRGFTDKPDGSRACVSQRPVLAPTMPNNVLTHAPNRKIVGGEEVDLIVDRPHPWMISLQMDGTGCVRSCVHVGVRRGRLCPLTPLEVEGTGLEKAGVNHCCGFTRYQYTDTARARNDMSWCTQANLPLPPPRSSPSSILSSGSATGCICAEGPSLGSSGC